MQILNDETNLNRGLRNVRSLSSEKPKTKEALLKKDETIATQDSKDFTIDTRKEGHRCPRR